jgi:hypothetical protein
MEERGEGVGLERIWERKKRTAGLAKNRKVAVNGGKVTRILKETKI